ncbi:MAG: type IVB secretion system protein DotA [Gammaproteobacteria bacterium]|nr:type IVB secretion system protein DotA [Gammaproteobacteria bacterium]
MNKRHFFSFLALSLLPALVCAEGYTLTPPNSDISFQYLADIFGVVSGVLHGSGTQIFGTIFNVFNSSILALGGIIVTYTFFVSTINTAGQGEVMGRDWSSIWIPIRSAGGIALLLPKGTGYSAIQVFMMWVVVQGIGAADRIWDTTLDYLKQGGVIIQQSATGFGGSSLTPGAQIQALQAVAQLFANSICLNSYQTYLQTQHLAHEGWGPPPDLYGLVSTQIAFFQQYPEGSPLIGLPWNGNIGSRINTLVNMSALQHYGIGSQCGSLKVSLPRDPMSSSNAPLTQARLLATQQIVTDLQTAAMTTQMQYLASKQPNASFMSLGFSGCPPSTLPCIGNNCSNSGGGTTCSASALTSGAGLLSSTLFQDTLSDYTGIVYAASQGPNGGLVNTLTAYSTLSINVIKTAKEDGWLMAGRYYIDLANANNRNDQFSKVWTSGFPISVTAYNTGSVANWNGILTDTTAPTIVNRYINGAMNYYTANGNQGGNNSSKYVAQGTATGLSVGLSVGLGVLAAMTGPAVLLLLPIFLGLMDLFLGFADLLSSQQTNLNPIAAISIMGDGMMTISLGFFIVGAVVSFVLSMGLGAVPCCNLGDGPIAMITWLAPLMSGFIALMFSSGAIMAYYIPMIPFILFTFGGIGWFIGVIEAMVAAPLVALGIAHPEGHQAFGKGEPAIMLTANVFLKPSLMLIGYVAGISMSYVGVWVLNRGFMAAFFQTVFTLQAQGTVIGSVLTMVGAPLAGMILYTVLAMIIVQKAFSLIHVVPERVLKWIGGSVEGHMEGQMEEQAKAGMQKGAQEGGSTMAGGMKAGGEAGAKAFADRKKAEKETNVGARAGAGGGGSGAKIESAQSSGGNTGGGGPPPPPPPP